MFVCRVFSEFLSVWCETKWNVWKHKFAEKKSCFIYLCRFIFFMGKYLQICAYLTLSSCAHISLCVCVCPTFPARYCWSFHQTWCLEVSAPRQFLLRRWSTSAASSPPASCPGTPYWTTNTRRTEMNYKHPSKTPRCHQKHQIKRHKKSSSVAVAMLTSLLPR